jgi:hypothetical protein
MAFFAFFVELRGVFSVLKGGVWQVFKHIKQVVSICKSIAYIYLRLKNG